MQSPRQYAAAVETNVTRAILFLLGMKFVFSETRIREGYLLRGHGTRSRDCQGRCLTLYSTILRSLAEMPGRWRCPHAVFGIVARDRT